MSITTDPADDRLGQPHPLPRRFAHRHLSREPTTHPEHLEQVVVSLLRLNVDMLITIGATTPRSRR